MAAKLIPLQDLYLAALAVTFESEKFDTVIQPLTDGPTETTGRLYLVRGGTTVADAVVQFKFTENEFFFEINTRDQRCLAKAVKYFEGVDGLIDELRTFLRANRLAAPAGRGLGKTGSRINPQG